MVQCLIPHQTSLCECFKVIPGQQLIFQMTKMTVFAATVSIVFVIVHCVINQSIASADLKLCSFMFFCGIKLAFFH